MAALTLRLPSLSTTLYGLVLVRARRDKATISFDEPPTVVALATLDLLDALRWNWKGIARGFNEPRTIHLRDVPIVLLPLGSICCRRGMDTSAPRWGRDANTARCQTGGV